MQTLRTVLRVKGAQAWPRLPVARQGGRQDSILRQHLQLSPHLLCSSLPLPAPLRLLSPHGVGALTDYGLSKE